MNQQDNNDGIAIVGECRTSTLLGRNEMPLAFNSDGLLLRHFSTLIPPRAVVDTTWHTTYVFPMEALAVVIIPRGGLRVRLNGSGSNGATILDLRGPTTLFFGKGGGLASIDVRNQSTTAPAEVAMIAGSLPSADAPVPPAFQ